VGMQEINVQCWWRNVLEGIYLGNRRDEIWTDVILGSHATA
jgi:hypothetical protein